MDERAEALIRQIAADPHDRALRLVLADLFLEQGDPRAEMMQLADQLRELHWLEPEHAELSARLLVLQNTHAALIAGDIANVAAVTAHDGCFVDTIAITVEAFRAHGDRLLATHPIRHVTIEHDDGSPLGPGAARVRSFELTPRRFAERAMWPRLASLRIADGDLSDQAPPLVDALVTPNLTALQRVRGKLGARELGSLLARLPGLTAFHVVYATPDGFAPGIVDELFARVPACPGLRDLRLTTALVEDKRVARLIDRAPNLERVQLDGLVGPKTCAALARCTHLVDVSLEIIPARPAAKLLALPKLRDLLVRGAPDGTLTRAVDRVPTRSPIRRVIIPGRPPIRR